VRKKAFQGRVQEIQANGEFHIRRQEEKPIDEEAWQVNTELRVSEQLAVVMKDSAIRFRPVTLRAFGFQPNACL